METSTPDPLLVERLRNGDEAAFRLLVVRHHAAMVRFAETFVPSRAVAEEVAQEAWLGVIKGIDRFEGRSSLSTWIFRIVANIGRTRGARERRSEPTTTLLLATGGCLAASDGGRRVAGQRAATSTPVTTTRLACRGRTSRSHSGGS